MSGRGIGSLTKALTNPSVEGIEKLIFDAERETWLELDNIERSTQITKTFKKYTDSLKRREERLLHEFGSGPKLASA
jgi:hypothetical protein